MGDYSAARLNKKGSLSGLGNSCFFYKKPEFFFFKLKMYLVSVPILKKMEPWVQFRSGSLKKNPISIFKIRTDSGNFKEPDLKLAVNFQLIPNSKPFFTQKN
jgi:hypothetical protein